MTARAKQSGPVPRAGRCYRTAPGNVPDAFEYVAEKLRGRGWTPVEQDYSVTHVDAGPEGNDFFWVELWAVPPVIEPVAEAS